MCARKRKKVQNAHYLISFDPDEDVQDSPAIVGHVLGLGFNPLKGAVGKARRYLVTTNGGMTRGGIPAPRRHSLSRLCNHLTAALKWQERARFG